MVFISEFLAFDIFSFVCSPSVAPKQRRVVEDGVPATAGPSDMAESLMRVGGTRLQSPEEIPVGEPIVPPYNGSNSSSCSTASRV